MSGLGIGAPAGKPVVVNPPSSGDATSMLIAAAAKALSLANGNGATVYVNAGTYNVSSLIGASKALGGVRFVGDGKNGSVFKKTTNVATALFDFSGNSNADRCQRGGLMDVKIDGGGFTGPLVRAKWADHLNFDRVWFFSNADQALYLENCWDTYFRNAEFDTCSGTDGLKPSVLISANSDDSSNEIYFNECRWEAFHDGALWISSRPPVSSNTMVTGTNPPYGIWLTNCKWETTTVTGLPFNTSTDVGGIHFNGMYCAFRGGASTLPAFNIVGAMDWSFEKFRVFVNGSAGTTLSSIFAIFTNAEILIHDVIVDPTQALGTGIIDWQGGTPDVYLDNVRYKQGSSGTLYAGSAGNIAYPTLASAATITPWVGPRTYQVTGTTTITAIAVLRAGYVINLVFAASVTVTNVATVKLAGAANFSATADDVLTLISDGTNWREVGRSVN